MYKDVIGILGGMGSYATLGFFSRLLESFPAQKEWDRPHIIIDNFCTMPSRVRAILYEENTEALLQMMSASIEMMSQCYRENGGELHIILACNTAHHFLPQLQSMFPNISFINIIQACAMEIEKAGCREVLILASEGTIDSKIYDEYLTKTKIVYPYDEMKKIRFFIEAVKQQHEIDEKNLLEFHEFLESFPQTNIVLGCTELPVLYNQMSKKYPICSHVIYDPLSAAITQLEKTIQ